MAHSYRIRKYLNLEHGLVFAITGGYLLLFNRLTGLRSEHLVLSLFCIFSYLIHPVGKKFVLGFSAFLIYWVLWDGMKAFPNFWFHEVSVEGIYSLEKEWFGVIDHGTKITINEFMLQSVTAWKDILSAICYFSWVPIPLIFGAYLFFIKPDALLLYSLCFLVSNLIGFILYYTLPAAPPWYVALYGFSFNADTPGHAAGLLRTDDLLGIHLFRGMYAKSSNVFAAFPSLHAAYPLVAFFYAFKNKLVKWSFLLLCLSMGIWWSALYTQHHYLVDVLAGIGCGVTGFIIIELLHSKSKIFKSFISNFAKLIAIQ